MQTNSPPEAAPATTTKGAKDQTRGPYRRTSDFRVSATDPDASPLPHGAGRSRLGYHDHYVVDGGKARIVLTALVTPAEVQDNRPALDLLWRARFRWKLRPRQVTGDAKYGTYVVDGGKARIVLTALVTPAEVQDNRPALDLLWRARFRWKLRPRQVTGDAKYGTVENIVAIEDQRIRAYVPLSEVGQRADLFGEQDFRFDAAADVYRCPGGQTLRFLSACATSRRRIYQAPTAACSACALRERCTTSPRGRRVGRSFDEPYLDRVRGYHATEPYAKAMRKRKVWVEPLFAEAKDWHGLRRFRLQGAEKVNIQAQLIAAGQNLKRLLSRLGWGRRPWPSGAAGVVLPAARTAAISPW